MKLVRVRFVRFLGKICSCKVFKNESIEQSKKRDLTIKKIEKKTGHQ